MKVVVLCGGLGTRMREETEYRPKPMVDIGGRPILWHIMKSFAQHGLNDFVLCLGYRGNIIKEYFLNYEAMNNDCTVCLGNRRAVTYHSEHPESGFQVTLADTGTESMTGGRLKRVERYLEDSEDFILTYGDGVSDVNLNELIAFHRSHGRVATVTAVRPTSRFGVLDIGECGEVHRFIEKPPMENWISAGYFVLNRRIFDYLEGGDGCVFEREPLERLAADQQLAAYRHDGFFFAMDTYREYKYLNDLWSSGDAPWKTWQ